MGLRDRFNKAASKALTSAVLGEPYTGDSKPRGTQGALECMPAEGSSANRLQDLGVPDMPMQKVAAFGSSHKTMFVAEVPEPGGRYLAKVEQPVYDDEAHIRIVS